MDDPKLREFMEGLVLLEGKANGKKKADIRSEITSSIAKRLVGAVENGDLNDASKLVNLVYMLGYSAGYEDGGASLSTVSTVFEMIRIFSVMKGAGNDKGDVQGPGPVGSDTAREDVQPQSEVEMP